MNLEKNALERWHNKLRLLQLTDYSSIEDVWNEALMGEVPFLKERVKKLAKSAQNYLYFAQNSNSEILDIGNKKVQPLSASALKSLDKHLAKLEAAIEKDSDEE